jgi:hypothetical protein
MARALEGSELLFLLPRTAIGPSGIMGGRDANSSKDVSCNPLVPDHILSDPEALTRILEPAYLEADVSDALRIAMSSSYALWIELKTT